MTKKKIKVLDIIPESNENDTINDDVEAVKETEPIEEKQEKQEEIVEEPQEQPQPQEIQETPTEIVEETTKTREQQLRQCPKCLKWLTPKTLRYFHQCTKNDTVKAKRRPHKKVIEVKKCGGVQMNMSKNIKILSNSILPEVATHPITGGKAPAAPPITIF